MFYLLGILHYIWKIIIFLVSLYSLTINQISLVMKSFLPDMLQSQPFTNQNMSQKSVKLSQKLFEVQ